MEIKEDRNYYHYQVSICCDNLQRHLCLYVKLNSIGSKWGQCSVQATELQSNAFLNVSQVQLSQNWRMIAALTLACGVKKQKLK